MMEKERILIIAKPVKICKLIEMEVIIILTSMETNPVNPATTRLLTQLWCINPLQFLIPAQYRCKVNLAVILLSTLVTFLLACSMQFSLMVNMGGTLHYSTQLLNPIFSLLHLTIKLPHSLLPICRTRAPFSTNP